MLNADARVFHIL